MPSMATLATCVKPVKLKLHVAGKSQHPHQLMIHVEEINIRKQHCGIICLKNVRPEFYFIIT